MATRSSFTPQGRPRARSMASRLLNDTLDELTGLAVMGVSEGIGASMLASGEVLNKTQTLVARVMAEKKLPDAERRQIHEDAARAAQRSLLAGYDNRRRRRNTPVYRTTAKHPRNVRLAGGILRRALARPEMIDVTANSIFFIDATMLDREAAHWRRINFGAGRQAGGASAGKFPLRWGSLVIGAFGLTDAASPAFKMPGGAWFEGEFYPSSEIVKGMGRGKRQKPLTTFGIASSQFLDAGVGRLATEIPKGYVGAIEEIYQRKDTQFAQLADSVSVPIKVFRPPGPSTFRSRRRRL